MEVHLKGFSLKCVFTNMHRWGRAGSTAAKDGRISSHCIQVVYFPSSGGCSLGKWKVMRKSTCWARSLPFSHIITEIDLSFPSPHSHPVSIERCYIWNACIFSFEMYTAAVQLDNMLHFIKKMSSQPLSGLESLFINEPVSLFDFRTYWNEWRQAEIPISSWCVGADRELSGLPPQRHQGEQRRKTVSEWSHSTWYTLRVQLQSNVLS